MLVMFGRQTSGSVVCVSCGYLVGVNDDSCYNCGRRNPGLWGFATAVRRLGSDMGFVPFVIGMSVVLYGLALLMSRGDIMGGGMFGILRPSTQANLIMGASGAVPVFVFDRWWTVLSAGWLHSGILHIFFNMYWVRQLAPAVSELYGPGRMVIVYTVATIVGTFTRAAMATSNATGMWMGRGMKQIVRPAPKAPVMLRRCSDQRRESANARAKGRAYQRSCRPCA